MIKEGKIGVQEAVALIVITISVKVYFTSPSFVSKYLGTASYIGAIASVIIAIIGFTFLYHLLKLFPNKDLIQILEELFGGFIGFTFSIVIFLFLIINSAILLREFGEVLKVYSLPTTSPSIISGLLLIVTSVACFLGLESIARAARLFCYFLLAGFLIVVILPWNNYNYLNLFPILGEGVDRILLFSVPRSSFFGEVFVLGIIAKSIQGAKHIKKVGYLSLIISGIITVWALVASLMAFNYRIAQEMTSQVYELAKIIHIGGLLQRLDPFFLFTWCVGTMVSVTFLFYCSISTYCKTFRIEDVRPVVIPLVIIMYTISLLPRDMVTVAYCVKFIREYSGIIYWVIPIISLILALRRFQKFPWSMFNDKK